jgi:hypothetical protein
MAERTCPATPFLLLITARSVSGPDHFGDDFQPAVVRISPPSNLFTLARETVN